MIYCVSDIHGRIDLFNKLLDIINLKDNDVLYVLGDCIDRGGGLAVLQKIIELSKSGKAFLIQGNHELNFIDSINQLKKDIVKKINEAEEYREFIQSTNNILNNAVIKLLTIGTGITNEIDTLKLYIECYKSIFSAFKLTGFESYHTCKEFFMLDSIEQENILNFISLAPRYKDVTVNNCDYRLLHAGYSNKGDVDLSIREEFFKNKSPLPDKTIIFGHTTTKDIRILTEGIYTEPNIWYDTKHKNDKICIDCGCSFYGGKLACLRLDDMKEYYIEDNKKVNIPIDQINSYFSENNFNMNELIYSFDAIKELSTSKSSF